MPSAFDNEFSSATPDFLSTFGEDTPIKLQTELDAAAITRKVIIPREQLVPVSEGQGANVFNELDGVELSSSDVDGVASIKEFRQGCNGNFHVFKIDGIWWTLKRVTMRNVGGMHRVTLGSAGQQAVQ